MPQKFKEAIKERNKLGPRGQRVVVISSIGHPHNARQQHQHHLETPQPIQYSLLHSETAIGMHEGNMIIYGGLGCEKNISWARFSFKNLEWSTPNHERIYGFIVENLQSSIYGHALKIYKGNAYVFGGTRLESSTN